MKFGRVRLLGWRAPGLPIETSLMHLRTTNTQPAQTIAPACDAAHPGKEEMGDAHDTHPPEAYWHGRAEAAGVGGGGGRTTMATVRTAQLAAELARR